MASSSNSKYRLPNLEFTPINLPPPDRSKKMFKPTGRKDKPRKVIKEAHFDPDLLEDTFLFEMLDKQNLVRLVTSDLVVYEDLVLWFYEYATIEFLDEASPPSMIISASYDDSFKLTYTSENFAHDFGLMYDGFFCEELRTWPTSFGGLTDRTLKNQVKTARLLNQIEKNARSKDDVANLNLVNGNDFLMDKLLRKNILPTKNKDSKCTKLRTVLLYLIKNFHQVNWVKMIGRHMESSFGNKMSATIPYGGLVTHIMATWRAKRPRTRLPDSNIINRSYLTTMGIYLVGDQFIRLKDRDSLSDNVREALDEEVTRCNATRRKRVVHSESENEDETPSGQRSTNETLLQQHQEVVGLYQRDMKKLKKDSKWCKRALKKLLEKAKMSCSSASDTSE